MLELPDLMLFLTELRLNNSKVWFDQNRSRYTALRQDFIALTGQIIIRVAEFDPSVAAVRAADSLFRINRDVRFSKDKSPYKSSFSAAISSGGRHSVAPIYYLQLGADESLAAGGIYMPEASELKLIREHIVRYPSRAKALLAHKLLQKEFAGLDQDNVLQRFPRGFEEVGELLKYKSFTVSAHFDGETLEDCMAFVVQKFSAMRPLHHWLLEALAYRE